MSASINGQTLVLIGPTPLLDVLKQNRIPEQEPGIAIAINGRVIRRALWPQTVVQTTDVIEVVHARQGG